MNLSTLLVTDEPNTKKKVINDTYRIIRKIGEGQHGKVLLAENIRCSGNNTLDKFVAIKTVTRINKLKLITKNHTNHDAKIRREIQIMKECDHPNIVKLYYVIDDLKYDKILLIMEYCSLGEIDWRRYNHFLEKYSKDEGIVLEKIVRDVTNGLEYLHEYKNIVHRDLKPSNLLIGKDKVIKISDFGVSLILEKTPRKNTEIGETVGTPAFFAPELCRFITNRCSPNVSLPGREKSIDARIDLWSLGVTLYCLVFKTLPFNGFNEFELFKNILSDDLKFPPLLLYYTNLTKNDETELNAIKDLIARLLTKSPNERATLEQVKLHEFTTIGMSTAERQDFIKYNKTKFGSGFSSKVKRLFNNIPTPLHNMNKKEKHHSPKPATSQDFSTLLETYLEDSSSSLGSADEEDSESRLQDKDLGQSFYLPTSTKEEKSDFFNQYYSGDSSLHGTRLQPALQLESPIPTNEVKLPPSKPQSPLPTGSPTIKVESTRPSFFSALPSAWLRSKSSLQPLPAVPDVRTKPSLTLECLLLSRASNDPIEPPPALRYSPNAPSPAGASSAGSFLSNRKHSSGSAPSARLASSSSSLNLHAYLTHENSPSSENRKGGSRPSLQLHSTPPSDSDPLVKPHPIPDPVASTVDSIHRQDDPYRFTSMAEYIDEIDHW